MHGSNRGNFGYSLSSGATFIPKKAAQCHMEPKKKVSQPPGLPHCAAHRGCAEPANFWCRCRLTWIGMNWLNRAVVLVFPNESDLRIISSNSEMGHLAGVVMPKIIHPAVYKCFFHNVGLWEKGPVWFGHCAWCFSFFLVSTVAQNGQTKHWFREDLSCFFCFVLFLNF